VGKIIKVAAIAMAVLICLVLLAYWVLEIQWRRDLITRGYGRFLDTTAEALERQVRNTIPIGSSRLVAEETLQNEGLRFSYDPPSQTIYAGAGYLKGSNLIILEGISFRLHFDKDAHLISIESHVDLTGP
jgi:hypothetical protein